jgi:hypothetical protein
MIRRETSMPPRAMVYHGSNVVDGGGLGHIISVCFGTTASGTTTFKKNKYIMQCAGYKVCA